MKLEKVLAFIIKNILHKFFLFPSKKLIFILKNFKKYFSGRKILIAKEITKMYEEFLREDIDKLKTIKNSLKGELTIVISDKKLKQQKNLMRKKL